MTLTGWCPPDAPHPRAHRECQRRIDAGLVDGCGCREHGGHTTPDETTEDAA